jgi:hypothetical protein
MVAAVRIVQSKSHSSFLLPDPTIDLHLAAAVASSAELIELGSMGCP